MVVMDVPAASMEERERRLQRANVIRSYRAQIKKKLASGELRLLDVLDSGDSELATMKVAVLLRAVPGCGHTKTQTVMHRAMISHVKTVDGMTRQQRERLEMVLRQYPMLWAAVSPRGERIR